MPTAINIIFEDDDIVVVDKPAGLPVLRQEGGVAESVEFPSPCGGGLGRGGPQAYHPAHRLDNNTSGCLVCAKTPKALEGLRGQFSGDNVFKEYTALVLGEPPPEGVIDAPIIHDPKDKKRMKIADTSAGHSKRAQAAHTEYRILKKFMGGRYCLLNVVIKTGVRHQIRVHLASIGHPLAGDRLYQKTRQKKFDETGLIRQFLHAARIGINHPTTGRRMEFSAPLAKELENVLTILGG